MLNIIPEPRCLRVFEGRSCEFFTFDTIYLSMDKEDGRIQKLLKKHFADMKIIRSCGGSAGCSILFTKGDSAKADTSRLTPVLEKEEGYYLKIREDVASIVAMTSKGLFYGIHTLLQLTGSGEAVACADIYDWPDVKQRSVYFDLRQVMPRFENIIKYIQDYAGYKINTMFIEYEDKIPFTKRSHLSHKELSFTEEQLKLIKETADDNYIEIIPIVQTFGHLEFVLKKPEYALLRENPGDTSTVCPLHPDTPRLLEDMTDEVMDRHMEARYIHIGCDEVTSLCSCSRCMEKFGGSREKAFIYHVNRLIGYVAGKGRIPVVYQDMIARFSDEELASLDNRAVVMIWLYYGTTIVEKVEALASKLRSLGIEIMGAPSISCHDRKDDQNYPVIEKRIPNIDQWAEAAVKLDISCVVITHWAVAGSFGCPYGIYETAFYLALYAAEKLWKVNSCSSSYLERFLHVFHGIQSEAAQDIYKDRDVGDYYDIIGSLAKYTTKNTGIAELIDIMKEFETGAYRLDQIGKYIYRLFSFPEDLEGERTALETRYREALWYLHNARARMEEKLKVFLPDALVGIYLSSRFLLPDYLIDNLYGKYLKE